MPISNLRLRVVSARTPVAEDPRSAGPALWCAVPRLPAGFWNAVTDPQGRCSIEGLPPGQYYVDHEDLNYGQIPGRNHHAFQHNPEVRKEEIEVRLNPAARVWGAVRLPDGTPVRGAKVNILESPRYTQGGLSAETFTDSEGRYELQRLLPSGYALQVRLNEGLKNDWTANPVGLTLETGELRKKVDLTVLRGGTISGKVTLSDTGAAVADMLVSVVSPKDFAPLANWAAITDKSGVFHLRVPAGLRKVYLAGMLPEGYTQTTKDGAQVEVRLNVEDGGTYNADFALPRLTGP